MLSANGSAVWFDDIRVYGNPEKPADYPAKPHLASSDNYEVGMNMCYLWRDSESLEGWDAVSPFAEFEPYLGYYDDGLMETADWELKQMAEHGVDFINVCWYAPQEKMSAPIKKMRYSHAALNEGYMSAENSEYVKFCIMWENSARYVGASNFEEFKEYIWKYWKEYYFSDPRYETLDGKALLTVWSLDIFLKTFGGTEGAAQAVEFMRTELTQMGYDGLVLLLCHHASRAAKHLCRHFFYRCGRHLQLPLVSRRLQSERSDCRQPNQSQCGKIRILSQRTDRLYRL